jgi:hypothetical protein
MTSPDIIAPGTRRSKLQTALLLCGLTGGVLFMINYTLLGATTPDYHLLKETISSLELVRHDGLQQANFILFGLLTIGYTFGLSKELIPGVNAMLILLLQLLTGIGLIGDGFFIHEPMHMVCDLITFNSAMLVLLFFTWQFYKSTNWNGWIAYSILSAVLMMGFLAAFGVANHYQTLPGLYERLAVVPRTLWTIIFVSKLLAGNRLISS